MSSSLLSFLGFQATVNGHQPSNHAPIFLLVNWLFAYCTLSTRVMKIALGLDHNASPRKDLATYGDAAVKAGKLTRQRLEQIERMQAAHENSVEGYAFFVAAILSATYAGVPNTTINRLCTWYTLSRYVYGAAYIFIENEKWSKVRSLAWWSCNASCFTGLILAGRKI